MTRNLGGLAMMSLLAFGPFGCGPAHSPAGASADAAPSADLSPGPAEPTTQSAGAAVMAYVNGKPIPMDRLIDLLVRGPGMAYARQLVQREVVRQEMERKKVVLTEADVRAETERIFKAMIPQIDTPQQREQVLARLLAQKQVSRKQWLLGVRLGAALRKLAEPQVRTSEEMLQAEFARRYGQQVQVRQIEVESLAKARKILEQLADGGDFAKLAWKHSLSESSRRGGLIDPIGPKTKGIPTAIHQTALSLKKAGEISEPIQVGTTFHILRLERVIEPENVRFEDVKDKIEADVRENLLHHQRGLILERLFREARIEYVAPLLKRLAAQGKQP